MNPAMFSKNSWHYRLATVYQFNVFNEPKTNICEYTSQVLYGILTAILIILFSSFMIYTLFAPIGYLIMGELYGYLYAVKDNVAVIIGLIWYVL